MSGNSTHTAEEIITVLRPRRRDFEQIAIAAPEKNRRHSALAYLSPINYERSHPAEPGFRRPTPSTETG